MVSVLGLQCPMMSNFVFMSKSANLCITNYNSNPRMRNFFKIGSGTVSLYRNRVVTALRAFEDYSADCTNRSPEDAALHKYLWRCAAQARALFEDAIGHVATCEGLDIE